jgi:hypothetical protein
MLYLTVLHLRNVLIALANLARRNLRQNTYQGVILVHLPGNLIVFRVLIFGICVHSRLLNKPILEISIGFFEAISQTDARCPP